MMNFIFADLRWFAEQFLGVLKRYFVLPFYKVPSDTPDRYRSIVVEKGVQISMRDGVRLNTNIYRPRGEEKLPVVMTRMPYGINEMYCFMPSIGKFWARKGYVFVVQDTRGRFDSEGEWDPFVHEIDDAYDTLEWISVQPWSDGNIAATGESYYGYTTWAAALSGHPNLKCIAPSTTSMDIYGEWVYNNGAFCMQTMGNWSIYMNAKRYRNILRLNQRHLPLISMAEEAHIPCEYYIDWIRHPARDDYWERINLHHRYSEIRIPVLHLGGWYDTFLKSTIDDWVGVREESDDPKARENQWLVVHPIDHEGTPGKTHRIGQLNIGEYYFWSRWEDSEQFFNYWLKGIDNGFGDTPRVKIFVMGDNDWRFEEEWPSPKTVFTKYHFHSAGNANTSSGDGALDTTEPEEEPPDSYIYDPENPINATLESDLWHYAETLPDRASVEKRQDVLVYSSEPLEEELEITGPIAVTLYAASSAKDTDFTATLVDVFPDGYCHMIQEGIIRARFRESDCEPTLIEPRKVYKFDIDLWATSYEVKKMHRLRVEISSSNFNRFDRNLNTGNPLGLDEEMVMAAQTIYHNREYPSNITLPVIPR